MPEWLRDPAARRLHIDLINEKWMDEDRSAEIHVTELYHCLTRMWNDKNAPLPLTDREVMMFACGFAFEEVFLRGKSSPNPPPKRYLFGMHMSPDHEVYPGREEDLKSTAMWAGQDGSPKKGWPAAWLYQFSVYGLSQLLPADTQFNSDWESLIPEDTFYDVAIIYLNAARTFEVLTLKFSKDEILQAIYYALDRKTQYERFVDEPPTPFKFNESYECDECRYFMRCDSYRTEALKVKRLKAKEIESDTVHLDSVRT